MGSTRTTAAASRATSRQRGSPNVDAEGRVAMWRGGGDGGGIWRLTIEQVREEMVGSGIVTPDDVEDMLGLCDDPDAAVVSQITMAAWGRRPR